MKRTLGLFVVFIFCCLIGCSQGSNWTDTLLGKWKYCFVDRIKNKAFTCKSKITYEFLTDNTFRLKGGGYCKTPKLTYRTIKGKWKLFGERLRLEYNSPCQEIVPEEGKIVWQNKDTFYFIIEKGEYKSYHYYTRKSKGVKK